MFQIGRTAVVSWWTVPYSLVALFAAEQHTTCAKRGSLQLSFVSRLLLAFYEQRSVSTAAKDYRLNWFGWWRECDCAIACTAASTPACILVAIAIGHCVRAVVVRFLKLKSPRIRGCIHYAGKYNISNSCMGGTSEINHCTKKKRGEQKKCSPCTRLYGNSALLASR